MLDAPLIHPLQHSHGLPGSHAPPLDLPYLAVLHLADPKLEEQRHGRESLEEPLLIGNLDPLKTELGELVAVSIEVADHHLLQGGLVHHDLPHFSEELCEVAVDPLDFTFGPQLQDQSSDVFVVPCEELHQVLVDSHVELVDELEV